LNAFASISLKRSLFMTNAAGTARKWDERASAPEQPARHTDAVFDSLFERSADAIWLLEVRDPRTVVLMDCNQAAVELVGAENKQHLLSMRPEDLSPPFQPDGLSSPEKTAEVIANVQRHKTHRFEWMMRRLDGREIPIEVSATAVLMGGKRIHIAISRDISERKKAARELVELNQSLERRVAERTAELTTSEARLRALVEHAPEAIVVFEGDTGRFLFGNDHACNLYGVPMAKLAQLTPADVSPEFQPGGRRSSELARELMDEALAGGTPVFEWLHQQPNGRLIPTEVRLLRLPSEGQNLIRASIIDNTERKRAEQALRESEEKFRALFEGSSHGVVLMDENKLLEVNPAAVRILGRRFAHEMVGKHPSEFSPPLQPNGVDSQIMAGKYIEECLAKGSVRLEWMCSSPEGHEIPLEVVLTRIEWSGRQVIQAFITDITERKRAERALREANYELHREVEQRTRAEQLLKQRVRMSSLNTGVALALNAGDELQSMLQRCCELVVQHLDVAFARIWTLNEATQTLELQASAGCYTHLDGPHSRVKVGELKIGLIAQEKKPRLTNNVQSDPRVSDKAWAEREGMVAFAGYPLLLERKVLGVLAMFARQPLAEDVLNTLGSIADSIALGIERKRSQTALAESETRFSAAFQASPIFITVSRMSDGRFVLVNDAFVNWSGYTLDEILEKNSAELGLWERPEDREAFWTEMQRAGCIRERECRLHNRSGKSFIMLLSSNVIQINHVPHLLAMVMDISARKQAEAELRASEARLRESEARFNVAFQASPVFINILRMSDRRYVWANDAFVNRLGYSQEEVLGRTSAEFGMWEDPIERDRAWEDMKKVGSIRQRECKWRNRRGESFTILLSAEIIKFNDAPHILSLALDITHRKRAEVELLKTLERERELSQLKSNFVSMVSHEFRTPLSIIQSSTELLRDFFQKMQPPEREEHLESIVRNTRRMAGMMEEILVLSRLDAGKLEFQPAVLDLNGFCRRIADEVLSATNQRCVIELSLTGVSSEAKGDEGLLGHIFTNVLSNAVKYSEPGSTVSFVLRRNGEEAVCTVRDQGIGIDLDDQQDLFKAFHRGRNVGSRPGTGLGLLMVKRCVELHHGSVQLRSKLGEGTTVIIRLPVFRKDL
jgi:PAS domain S-box-containing protein